MLNLDSLPIPVTDGRGRYTLKSAVPIGELMIELLQPYCEKIAVAGSVRREKDWVKDVEILAVPKTEVVTDLFENPVKERDLLDERMNELLSCVYSIGGGAVQNDGLLAKREGRDRRVSWGPKNKFALFRKIGFPIDVFSTSFEDWGMSLMIRTGGAEFNKAMMVRFRQLGMKGHVHGGIDVSDDLTLHCAEEEDVFALLEWPYIEPQDRNEAPR